MKIRIQMGLEIVNGASRKVRLTPVDHTHDVPDTVAQALLLMAGVADLADLQPGDDEVDLPVGDLGKLAAQATVPGLVRDVVKYVEQMGIKGQVNVFMRVSRVE